MKTDIIVGIILSGDFHSAIQINSDFQNIATYASPLTWSIAYLYNV